MPKQKIRKGRVEYGERAFHQDAMEAMRGDIIRGLIEAVTNSDDAYASMEDGRTKRILVEVEHRRSQQWKVSIRDRGTGMRADDMELKLTRLGGRTSGFEAGEQRRGNLGRGAKDLAAFGDVTFESICDGYYSKVLLKTDGHWELTPANRSATKKDRERLGILRGNGFVVNMLVQPFIRCPQHEPLKRRLATHYALRDILCDPMRRVDLTNLNDSSTSLLTFQYPELPVAFETSTLKIPGYTEAKASLIIWRHPTRYDDGPQDHYRPIGILLKGDRAIYENTLFSYETNVHAGWFSGKFVCTHIDQLAREYDERLEKGEEQVPENPMPIITRRRDGLNPQHPFVEAIKKAIEGPLGELVALEAERSREDAEAVESEATRQALEKASRELSRMVNEELREIEAEELPGEGEGPVPLLSIIPEQAYAYMGEDRTLTITGRRKDIPDGAEVEISMDPAGVLELLTSRVVLRPHLRRDDVLVGQVRLRPLLEDEATIVSARYESASAAALLEVRPERIKLEPEELIPEQLQFERPSYRVGWQRQKELLVLSPAKDVAQYGNRLTLSSSDNGVAILTPSCTLKCVGSGEYSTAKARVEARILNTNAVITAKCKEAFTTTHVIVTRREESGFFKLILTNEAWGNFRAIIETETDDSGKQIRVIKIAGRHPAIRTYLGENFEFQETAQARSILAEVVADVTSRYVVSELYRLRRSFEPFDADRIYREHYKRVTRFLPRLQRVLVGDTSDAYSLTGPLIEVRQEKDTKSS